MLRIRVDYDLEDTGSGVAMGRGALGGATYKLSNRYVYHFRYTLENISTNTLSGVSFGHGLRRHGIPRRCARELQV
jgi:hypothetical protein